MEGGNWKAAKSKDKEGSGEGRKEIKRREHWVRRERKKEKKNRWKKRIGRKRRKNKTR